LSIGVFEKSAGLIRHRDHVEAQSKYICHFFCYLLAARACYDISFMIKMLNLRDLNKIARSEVES
jgi:hypothetical protein